MGNVFKKQPLRGFLPPSQLTLSSTAPEPLHAELLPPPQVKVSTHPKARVAEQPSHLLQRVDGATKPPPGLQDCVPLTVGAGAPPPWLMQTLMITPDPL